MCEVGWNALDVGELDSIRLTFTSDCMRIQLSVLVAWLLQKLKLVSSLLLGECLGSRLVSELVFEDEAHSCRLRMCLVSPAVFFFLPVCVLKTPHQRAASEQKERLAHRLQQLLVFESDSRPYFSGNSTLSFLCPNEMSRPSALRCIDTPLRR